MAFQAVWGIIDKLEVRSRDRFTMKLRSMCPESWEEPVTKLLTEILMCSQGHIFWQNLPYLPKIISFQSEKIAMSFLSSYFPLCQVALQLLGHFQDPAQEQLIWRQAIWGFVGCIYMVYSLSCGDSQPSPGQTTSRHIPIVHSANLRGTMV